jgi:putative Ca2+/H+ antiporter (TMEM165/GDT1 family)
MDWKVVATTFGMIFLAELGDKTQLAVITLAARTKSPLAVFLGAVGGFGILTLLGAAFGGLITKWIPEGYVKITAGVLFIIFGIWILLSKEG